MGIFSPEGKLMTSLNRYVDVFFLNLLALAVSLPIITAGAAITAKYYVSMKLVQGHDVKLIRGFFHSFKENFKQATMIWIPSLALFALLTFDFFAAGHLLTGLPMRGLQAFSLLMAFFLFGCLLFGFPMLARFELTNRNWIKNSFALMGLHFITAFLGLILFVAPFLLAYFLPQFAVVAMLIPSLLTLFVADRCVVFFQPLMPEGYVDPAAPILDEFPDEDASFAHMREEAEMRWPPVSGVGKVYREKKPEEADADRDQGLAQASAGDGRATQTAQGLSRDQDLVRASAEDEADLARALDSSEARRIAEKERMWADPHDFLSSGR